MKISAKSIDLTKGAIWKGLILFMLPLLFGDMFQQFYNLADSIIVGQHLGKQALAAVGSTSTLTNAIIGLFLGFSVGAGVIISQVFGAKDTDRLSRAIHTTLTITFLSGILFTALGLLLSSFLIRAIKAPADVYDGALLYIRIYFSGLAGLIVYNMGSGILRSIGDSKTPTIALVLSSLLNIVLDLLMVMVLGWGIAGAAIATVLTQFLSAAFVLARIARIPPEYAFCAKKLSIDPAIALSILRLGLPIGLQRMITQYSNLIVHSYINSFGSTHMAGWTIYNRIHELAILPMENFGSATTTFTGQNRGAKDKKRVQEGIWKSAALSILVTMGISVLLYLFAPFLAARFNADPAVIEAGTMFTRLLCPLFFMSSISRTYAGAVRGLGDSRGPMILMLVGYVATRQLYLAIGTRFVNTPIFIAWAYPMGWIVSSLLIFAYYHIQKKRLLDF